MTQGRWSVVRTQPRREQWARENVVRQGYDCYLPMTAEERRTKRGGDKLTFVQTVPLFASYLFVCITDRWHSLHSTFGVSSILMDGAIPRFIPQREIDKLKALEDEDGVIRLTKEGLFEVGDQVRVTQGPLAGQVGLFDGAASKDRVSVLLDFLGGRRSVIVPEKEVEAA